MYLTQKNHLKLNNEEYEVVKRLTKLSKNLYNYTLYTVRQYFIFNDKFLPYEQAYHMVKDNENYRLLPSQVAQQTMKVVERNMRSFFHILREKQKGNYNRPANPPKYLDKDGKFPCIWQKDMFKVNGDTIRLSLGYNFHREYGKRYLRLTLPKNVDKDRIKEVRIIPYGKGEWFEIEYVYESDGEPQDLDDSEYLSIDLGIDNFAACYSTVGTAFILEGRGLKSYNQWWNKEKSRVQSIYDKQGIENRNGSRMRHLSRQRKYKVNDFMNKAVRYIIGYCLNNRVGNIVVGELKEIKQGINIGKRNNQNFWSIPYGLFKRKLKAKCEYYGINYQEIDEAHTSKCDALALESVEHHDNYIGRRVKRGLFQSSTGKLINADVNGAINILRKVVGDSLKLGILDSGTVNVPERIRKPFGFQTTSEAPCESKG